MHKPVCINVALPSRTIAVNSAGDIQVLIIIVTHTDVKIARAPTKRANSRLIIERINGYLH